jgi:hypothetical protein
LTLWEVFKMRRQVTMSVYRATADGAVTISVVDDVGGHGWPGT